MKNTLILIIMALALAALAFASPLTAIAEEIQSEPVVEAEPVTQAEPAAEAAEGDAQLDEELEALLEGTVEKKAYKFPVIKPEYDLELGYTFSDFRNSPTAGRYVYHKKSTLVGLDIKSFNFPSRLHIEADRINSRDFFGDIRFALGDTLLFRWVGVGLYKNLERVTPTSAGYTMEDEGEAYGMQISRDMGTIRLKAADFPAHLYFKYWLYTRDGYVQQRYLRGSGYYDNLEIVTASRHIDTKAEEYRFGGNTHMGYMELQYEHNDGTYDPKSEQLSFANYTTSSFRSAGLWPHHQQSEFRHSNDTFQMHTTYTGKLVGSASISQKRYDNDSSGAESQYIVGATSFTWMPVTSTTFFLKYKYTRIDNDTPESTVITDYTGALSETYSVKPAINSSANDVSLVGRFRVSDSVVLRARFIYEQILRDNAEEWGLENGETKTKTGWAAINIKPASSLTLHGDYIFSDMSGQAYNTDFDVAHKVNAGADWAPTEWLSFALSYSGRGEDRDNLTYSDTEGAKDRRIYRENSMLSVNLAATERLHLTATYNQLYNSNRQDIVYYDASNVATVSPGVLYTDEANCYALDLSYTPHEKVSLGTGVSYTLAEGKLQTSNTELTLPVSIEDLTAIDYIETSVNAYSDFRLGRGLSMKLEYEFTKLNDTLESEYDSIDDGTSHLAMVYFKKKW